jgi:hypothetical protein
MKRRSFLSKIGIALGVVSVPMSLLEGKEIPKRSKGEYTFNSQDDPLQEIHRLMDIEMAKAIDKQIMNSLILNK